MRSANRERGVPNLTQPKAAPSPQGGESERSNFELRPRRLEVPPPIGVVILAAGASTRMGRPKQLLEWAGSPLLFHLTLQAILSRAQKTIAILGYEIRRIAPRLIGLDALVVENPEWREGVASSIRRAVEVATAEAPELEGLLFITCDQPHVTAATINRMLEAQRLGGKTIVASEYDGTLGVPALFMKAHYSELLGLRGDRGAREIIASHPEQVERVPFPEGAVDIDTEGDWERILRTDP